MTRNCGKITCIIIIIIITTQNTYEACRYDIQCLSYREGRGRQERLIRLLSDYIPSMKMARGRSVRIIAGWRWNTVFTGLWRPVWGGGGGGGVRV